MTCRLSICIPTYNRVARLKPLLAQIVALVGRSSASSLVEVCVSDNGSDDGTWPLLQEFGERHAFFSIRKNEKNQGFGRNFWAAAAMAQGEYIYFSGDDDLFHDHALETLLRHVETGADLILVNSHPTAHLRNGGFRPNEACALDSLESYLEKLGIFHGSFIGNLLFRREVFRQHCDIGDAVFLSAYPHLFPVFRALRKGNCLFANQPITKPDDSERGWRKMQPIYTSVDVARIARLEVVPFVGRKVGWMLMFRLARSLPRAMLLHWKRVVLLDTGNPFQSLRPANVLNIYL